MKYSEYLSRYHFTRDELVACAHGKLVEDPPANGVPRLPAPPFLMFDRVTEISREGRTGRIVAECRVRPEAWYFRCHFDGDPVQPGCLGLDAVWQLVGFFCGTQGAAGSGRALGVESVEFLGQIRPYDQLVRYEVDIRRFRASDKASLAVADATVSVDGVTIYTIKGARVGVFPDIAYADFPNPRSRHARGGIVDTSRPKPAHSLEMSA
jgi:3-hydroxyacyl-[acyl-carrier protein] dehydratase/trans-2-decenoyl-[acyl-carrier protein] isomerase